MAERPAVRLLAAMLALAAPAAFAQRWAGEVGITSQLTWSTDAGIGASGSERGTGLEVRPRIVVLREGGRLKVDGTAAVDAFLYGSGGRTSQVFPEADITAKLEAVDRLVFFEAAYRAALTSNNPFGARPEAGNADNRVAISQFRFSPVIEHTSAGGLHFRVRSDNTWGTNVGGTEIPGAVTGGGYFGRHGVLVEQPPRPFGWSGELERSQTRYRDPSIDPLVLDAARLRLLYALNEEFSAGLRFGREKSNFLLTENSGTLYGAEATWRPSTRTTLTAAAEKRFFGNGWRFAFDHRMPMLAWNLSFTRDVDTAPQSFFELPATDNVSKLLDEMFTTRFPDPVERLRIVRDFIAQQGLPSSTVLPTNIINERLSLVTSRNASVALIGTRNTIALNAFHVRTQDLLESGPLAATGSLNNNLQYGASVSLTHRLTPTAGLTALADWSRIRGLGAQAADATTQRGVRLQMNMQAGPKTSAFAGARLRKIDSTVTSEGREGAVFAGMDHRF